MRTLAIICVECVLAGFLLFCNVLKANGGERGVIGVRVTVENEWLTVLATLDNSPANLKGLRAGDRIVKIDGQSTKDRTLPDCIDRIAGPPGEDVTLTVVQT